MMRRRSGRDAPPVPSTTGVLRTRDGHRVSFTVAGAADGVPVVVLHGGPGSGSQPGALRLFDLTRFRVVLIDQRGTGASTPHGSVRHNRTDRLIDDIEAIRVRLGVERWGVLGGSWGAALALAYAGRHPCSVTGVVLRGLFLTSAREVRGLFVTARQRAPRAWARLCAAARCERPAALLARCHEGLQRGAGAHGAIQENQANEANQAIQANQANQANWANRANRANQANLANHANHASQASPTIHPRQQTIALAWRGYENAVLASASSRRAHSPVRASPRDTRKLAGKYRIQAHYLMHRCWLGETRLLALARRAAAAGIPLAAIHGLRDPVCPPDNARRLARAVPAARVDYVRAGHLASDPALHERVREALATMFLSTAQEGRIQRRAA
jgi:proline iminopeptidase